MGQEPTPLNRPVPSNTPGTPTGGAPVPPPAPPPTTTTPQTDDPEVIRQDIDRTRGEMEGTLSAINDRVNPQRVYDRRTGKMRQRWSSFRNSIMGSSDTSSSYGSSSSSWRDRTPDVDARGRAQQTKQSMSDASQQAKQAVSDAPQQVQQQTRGNPLTAGMIAFGIGSLIGSALPDSKLERRAAREATEHVDVEGTKQRMTEHAKGVQETVQERARDAADDIKGSATDAAQEVKGQAQQEGQRVKGDAKESGQQVRRQS